MIRGVWSGHGLIFNYFIIWLVILGQPRTGGKQNYLISGLAQFCRDGSRQGRYCDGLRQGRYHFTFKGETALQLVRPNLILARLMRKTQTRRGAFPFFRRSQLGFVYSPFDIFISRGDIGFSIFPYKKEPPPLCSFS